MIEVPMMLLSTMTNRTPDRCSGRQIDLRFRLRFVEDRDFGRGHTGPKTINEGIDAFELW